MYTLYSYKNCPFCHRVLLVLRAKSIPYKLFEVDLKNKPQEFLSLGCSTVPVLVGNGLKLADSKDILEYLFNSAVSNSDVEMASWFDSVVIPEIRTFLRTHDHHLKEVARSRIMEYFGKLADVLRLTAYLSGDEPQYADYAISPFVDICTTRGIVVPEAISSWIVKIHQR